MTGAPAAAARSASGPLPVTATTDAPEERDAEVAVRVSSVVPENERANTTVPGPTNDGTEAELTTVTGMPQRGAANAFRTPPARALVPMPTTTTDVSALAP